MRVALARAFGAFDAAAADRCRRPSLRVFRVPPQEAGQRVDLFIQSQLHRNQRTRRRPSCGRARSTVFGRRPSERPRAGRANDPALAAAMDGAPVPMEVPILYEDEHLLAVDSSALLPVHPTARYQICSSSCSSRCDLMLRSRRSDIGSIARSAACYARVQIARLRLSAQTNPGPFRVEKTYVAIARGVPDWGALSLASGTMEYPPNSACRRRTGVDDRVDGD